MTTSDLNRLENETPFQNRECSNAELMVMKRVRRETGSSHAGMVVVLGGGFLIVAVPILLIMFLSGGVNQVFAAAGLIDHSILERSTNIVEVVSADALAQACSADKSSTDYTSFKDTSVGRIMDFVIQQRPLPSDCKLTGSAGMDSSYSSKRAVAMNSNGNLLSMITAIVSRLGLKTEWMHPIDEDENEDDTTADYLSERISKSQDVFPASADIGEDNRMCVEERIVLDENGQPVKDKNGVEVTEEIEVLCDEVTAQNLSHLTEEVNNVAIKKAEDDIIAPRYTTDTITDQDTEKQETLTNGAQSVFCRLQNNITSTAIGVYKAANVQDPAIYSVTELLALRDQVSSGEYDSYALQKRLDSIMFNNYNNSDASWWEGFVAKYYDDKYISEAEVTDDKDRQTPSSLRGLTDDWATKEYIPNADGFIDPVPHALALLDATLFSEQGFLSDMCGFYDENSSWLAKIVGTLINMAKSFINHIKQIPDAIGAIVNLFKAGAVNSLRTTIDIVNGKAGYGWLMMIANREPIDLATSMPYTYNAIHGYGGELAMSKMLTHLGGVSISKEDLKAQMSSHRKYLAYVQAQKPLMARLFDGRDYNSFVQRFARTADFDSRDISLPTIAKNLMRFASNAPQTISSSVASITRSNVFAANQFALETTELNFGYRQSELNKIVSNDFGIINNTVRATELLADEEVRGNAEVCFGVAIDSANEFAVSVNTDYYQNFVDIGKELSDSDSNYSVNCMRTDDDWLSVRQFLMHSFIVQAALCYIDVSGEMGADTETACSQFNANSSSSSSSSSSHSNNSDNSAKNEIVSSVYNYAADNPLFTIVANDGNLVVDGIVMSAKKYKNNNLISVAGSA